MKRFHLGDIPVFGEHAAASAMTAACCVPATTISFAQRPKPNVCCG